MKNLRERCYDMDDETRKIMAENSHDDNIATVLYYDNEARKRALAWESDEDEKLSESQLRDEFLNSAPVASRGHLNAYLQFRLGDRLTANKLRSVWSLVLSQVETLRYSRHNPLLLNTWFGFVDVRTKQLVPRTSQPLAQRGIQTRFIPHYDAKATAPTFARVLNDLNTDANPTLGQDLLRMYAYCAFGGGTLKKLFILLGDGDDGKSLIQNAVRRALGDYVGIVSPSKVRYSRTRDDQFQTWLANMDGKRFATVSEWSESDRLDNALIKNVVSGGDSAIEIEQKNLTEQLHVALDFTMVIDTNFLPDVSHVEPALLKRLAVMTFHKQYSESERDLTLGKRLTDERAGILNMLIEAYDPDWRVPEQYCNQIVALQDEQRVESDDMLALILRKHGYTVAVNALDSKLNVVDVLCAKVHDDLKIDLKTHGFKIKVLKDYLTRQGVTVSHHDGRMYHGLKHEITTY